MILKIAVVFFIIHANDLLYVGNNEVEISMECQIVSEKLLVGDIYIGVASIVREFALCTRVVCCLGFSGSDPVHTFEL